MVKNSDFLAWAIGAILVVALVASVISAFSRIGIDILDPAGSLRELKSRLEQQEFSDDTPLGTLVEAVHETEVWERAGGGSLLGVHKKGIRGILTGGPTTIDGERWWLVDFDNDPDGWVRESSLRIREYGLNLFLQVLSVGWKRFAVVVSLLALIGIVYSVIRINQIRKADEEELNLPKLATFVPDSPESRNEKWDRVMDLVNGESPNDWRQAIIEADIMLDELVSKVVSIDGTMADKLKAVEPSDFLTLQLAWEAHKVRNRIAHDGGDFILTQKEALRVLRLFEEVFNEFQII